MISVPVSPNSVCVSMVQTGCLKAEFDSTYPIHLNGIISPDEYRHSINRINQTISSNKILLILAIVFIVSIIGGMIFFIVGGVTGVRSHTFGFPPLIIVGIVVTAVGSILFSIGCCLVQVQRASKLRQAISEESMKYSSRPIPCSWRLETTRYFYGGYGNHYNNHIINHLIIDIGRPNVPTNGIMHYPNQIANESVQTFSRPDNYAPPPYAGQSTGFCSQCGASRHDFTARFCSSCGQLFNKY